MQLDREKDKFDIILQVYHVQIYLDYPQFTKHYSFCEKLE